jgi:hypothetical protein
MSQSGPIDHALAAIASIFDHPKAQRQTPKADIEDHAAMLAPQEANGYFKIGPGPMPSIRFKWTVRHGDGDAYYVDETIGENSVAAVSGPMTRDAAIGMVNDRERDARQRFEELKSEMAGRSAAALLLHKSGGEV